MTVGQLQTYCDCYAKAFAEIMSVEDLDNNKGWPDARGQQEGWRILPDMRGDDAEEVALSPSS